MSMNMSHLYKTLFFLGLGAAGFHSYGTMKDQDLDSGRVPSPIADSSASQMTVQNQEIKFQQPHFSAEAPALAVSPVVQPGEMAMQLEMPPVATAEEGKEGELAQSGDVSFPDQPPMPAFPMNAKPIDHQAQASVEQPKDLPLLPNALPTPAPKASVSSFGGSSHAGTSHESASLGLKKEDYAALISPLKASFDDVMKNEAGLVCAGDAASCSSSISTPVHSLRWSMDEGLRKDVSFVIKSIGPSLQFDINFKIQKSATVEESVQLQLSPLNIFVSNESKNGKNFRKIDFHFADFPVRGESMKNVHASMLFEVTDSGLVPTTDSSFTFSRSKASVSLAKWDPSSTPFINPMDTPVFADNGVPGSVWNEPLNRTPAAEIPSYLIVDELDFSIKVEKSL